MTKSPEKLNNDMTLEDVMKIARAEISTRLAMQAMNSDGKPVVRYLSYEKKHGKGKTRHAEGHQNSSQNSHTTKWEISESAI